MLKRLLLCAIALIGCATQAMDRPVHDYSRFPEEMKLEIVKNIIKKNDFSFLAKFMEARKENKGLVLKYLLKNADAVIHQALASTDPAKGVEFLDALGYFDKRMWKKIGKYISDKDFKKLKSIEPPSSYSSCYMHQALVETHNLKIATIMLSNPEISNDCLRSVAATAIMATDSDPLPVADEEKPILPLTEALEFIKLVLDHPLFNDKQRASYDDPLLFDAITFLRPISVVKGLIDHPKIDINDVRHKVTGSSRLSTKSMTALDIANKIKEFADAPESLQYKKDVIALLKTKGAKTYRELKAKAK